MVFCYYSNMIEGPNTMANDTDDDQRRDRLRIGLGHVITQDDLDAQREAHRIQTRWSRFWYRVRNLFGGISG